MEVFFRELAKHGPWALVSGILMLVVGYLFKELLKGHRRYVVLLERSKIEAANMAKHVFDQVDTQSSLLGRLVAALESKRAGKDPG